MIQNFTYLFTSTYTVQSPNLIPLLVHNRNVFKGVQTFQSGQFSPADLVWRFFSLGLFSPKFFSPGQFSPETVYPRDVLVQNCLVQLPIQSRPIQSRTNLVQKKFSPSHFSLADSLVQQTIQSIQFSPTCFSLRNSLVPWTFQSHTFLVQAVLVPVFLD